MIFIKSKAGASISMNGDPVNGDKDHGILIEPDLGGEVGCDENLYRIINEVCKDGGGVRIAVGLFGRHGEQVLTAQEFCAQWKGD